MSCGCLALASISLAGPNDTEIITLIRTATGFADGYDGNPPHTFQEYRTPGRSTYFVRAPVAFDICDRPGPVGQVCFADVHIWGNGGRFGVSGNAPVFPTFSESLIPEPGTWALLSTGFALIGTLLRRSPQPSWERAKASTKSTTAGVENSRPFSPLSFRESELH